MLYCTPLANLFWRLCSIVCMPDGGWGFPPDASLLPTSFLRAVSILLFWRLPGSGGTDQSVLYANTDDAALHGGN
uniref:Putative secreted protein n=1 Tax=Ixodes ricinus TaxID=34613 RepID=A0A6B0UAZ8_IXORI